MYENKEELLLSFDLSSITVGYALFSLSTKELKHMSYWKYNKDSMLDKAFMLEIFIHELLNSFNIKSFCIEERLKSFRAGGTSAEAMIKTSCLNFNCQTIFHKKGIEIKELNVNTVRKLAIPGFHSIARKIKGKKQKEIAFEFVVKELGEDKFPSKVLKSGPRKGETDFLEEAKDMADAYLLGKSFLILSTI